MADRKTTEQFVKSAIKIHGDRYDYSETQYVNSRTKVSITCKIHGPFEISPNNHIGERKSGCQKCGMELAKEALARGILTQNEMFKDPDHREAHAAKCRAATDVDKSRANGLKGVDDARCVSSGRKGGHGHVAKRKADPKYNKLFLQRIRSQSSVRSSKTEMEINDFVKSLGFDVVANDRTVIAPKHIDVLVPSKKVGIEVNGVWWHNDISLASNRVKTLAEAKKYHFNKSKHAASVGHRLIHITDVDWAHKRSCFERIIKMALGVADDVRLSARDCKVVELTRPESSKFLDQYHIQGATSADSVKVGLKHPLHGLVAVMTFSKGANIRGPARTKATVIPWNLTRFATCVSVRGGAGKLLKYASRKHNMDTIESYSANDWFTGAMYEALGFVKSHESPPDYRVYHKRTGFVPKSHWQRRNIPKMLARIGSGDTFDPDTDSRTEFEMQDSNLALRIWDSGKILWRWTSHDAQQGPT